MKYVEVSNGLYLVQQEVPKGKTAKKVRPSINHIWMYDRSGSMCGVIHELCADLKVQVRTLPVGDTITLGWFSSEGGEFDFIFKGFKITDSADYKILENAIDKNNYTLGATCFSEILTDTDKVIKDLSSISENFSLMFFTDGHPVVRNYSREVESIFSAIEKIEGKLTSSLLIGYGHYYNKTFMADMASRLGAGLIHSENLHHFTVVLKEFLGDSRDCDPKIKVELPELKAGKKRTAVFSLNGKQISIYKEEDGSVNFTPSTKVKDFVYYLQDVIPTGAEKVEFTDTNVTGKSKAVEEIVKATYAASYILTQSTKTDKALEVLSCLGDKALINSVNNAFTNTEYGAAEEKIREAVFSPSKRFSDGRDTKYLPAADAFCLLDAVDVLMTDKEAKFYPYNEKFVYNRIGAEIKTKGDYPKFEPDRTTACNMSNLVWNSSKLNLSVLAQIHGTVKLKGNAKKYGFAEDYPTWIYRTYTLVKDGFCNMASLPVSLSSASFKTLQSNGMIDTAEKYKEGEVYILNLNSVPVINRSIADGKTSAKDLCKKCFTEIELEAKIKALNHYKNQLESAGVTKVGSTLTTEQEAFLLESGITKNGYNPPSEKGESKDYYMAKEFDIKIKGYSSLPKVDEVVSKTKELATGKGKPLTATAVLVNEGVKIVEAKTKDMDDKTKLAVLTGLILDHKKQLTAVRSDIQRTKFAIILGKRWFDEFTSREENTLELDGKTFTIAVRETRVDY